MLSLSPIGISLRAGTGVALMLRVSVTLARQKLSNISPLHLLLFLQVSILLFCNLRLHFFTRIQLQQPCCGKIRTLPATLSRAAPSLCSVTNTSDTPELSVSPGPLRRERHWEGGWEQKCLKFTISAMQPPLLWAGILLGDEAIPCTRSCMSRHGWGHPLMRHIAIKCWGSVRADARDGSSTVFRLCFVSYQASSMI